MVVESSAGGTGRHVMDLSEGLLSRGCEVHMIYSAGRMDETFRQRLAGMAGLRHAMVPMHRSIHPGDLAAAWAVRRYLRQCGPFDIIHGHSSKGGALARLAGLGTGASAVYTLHGLIMLDPAQPCWKRHMYRALERGLSLCTSRIIAVSPETQRAAVRLGLGRHRVSLVPNGIAPMSLVPRNEARQALGIAADARVIGFVGRLVQQKAPDVLLRAFALVLQTAPAACLAMVGAGPMEQPLRELAQSLGIQRQVLWLGHRDARTVLSAFDLLAMSSRYEGLPYVVLEAAAAGLPIVATSASGVEMVVDPGLSGEVTPADDPEALARALSQTISNPARLRAYSRAAKLRAGEFSVQAMVQQTLDLYRELAGVRLDEARVGKAATAPAGGELRRPGEARS